eukprot:COSAG01_NODE_126_length_24988_cov_7.711511_3_plen_210_part_00
MPEMYEAENKQAGCLGSGVLLPKAELKDVVIWRDYFLRWTEDPLCVICRHSVHNFWLLGAGGLHSDSAAAVHARRRRRGFPPAMRRDQRRFLEKLARAKAQGKVDAEEPAWPPVYEQDIGVVTNPGDAKECSTHHTPYPATPSAEMTEVWCGMWRVCVVSVWLPTGIKRIRAGARVWARARGAYGANFRGRGRGGRHRGSDGAPSGRRG